MAHNLVAREGPRCEGRIFIGIRILGQVLVVADSIIIGLSDTVADPVFIADGHNLFAATNLDDCIIYTLALQFIPDCRQPVRFRRECSSRAESTTPFCSSRISPIRQLLRITPPYQRRFRIRSDPGLSPCQ